MKSIILNIFILLLSVIIYADSIQTIGEAGEINWTTGFYTIKGYGAIQTPEKEPNRGKAYLKAKAYAELDATRNLGQLIHGTTFDSITTGSDFEEVTQIMTAKVSGQVTGLQIISDKKIEKNGGEVVEVIATCSMFNSNSISGQIFQKQLDKDLEILQDIKPSEIIQPKVDVNVSVPIAIAPAEKFPVELPKRKKEIDNNFPFANSSSDRPYTSVIFDVTGLSLARSMSPKIRLSNGDIVWCGADFDIDQLSDRGILVYCNNIIEAKKHKYAGENPLVIRVINICGNANNKCDMIITDQDAAILKNENIKGKFLDNFNVIAICDKYRK